MCKEKRTVAAVNPYKKKLYNKFYKFQLKYVLNTEK